MYRGTTPTLTFKMPFSNTGISNMYITFVQGRNTILEKTEADVVWNENSFDLELTQEDTLKFEKGMVMIQLRLKYTDGTALASNLIYTTAEAILKDGVI